MEIALNYKKVLEENGLTENDLDNYCKSLIEQVNGKIRLYDLAEKKGRVISGAQKEKLQTAVTALDDAIISRIEIVLSKKSKDDPEAKRLAEEAEAKRLAEEAEAKRLAEEAEAKRLIEESRNMDPWDW